jgi:hypothetical protein
LASLKARDGRTTVCAWRHRSWWGRLLGEAGVPAPVPDPGYPLFGGDPVAVPVLVELLRSPDATARWAAADGLERVGPGARAAVPGLLEARDDPDWAVAFAACKALQRIEPGANHRDLP